MKTSKKRELSESFFQKTSIKFKVKKYELDNGKFDYVLFHRFNGITTWRATIHMEEDDDVKAKEELMKHILKHPIEFVIE